MVNQALVLRKLWVWDISIRVAHWLLVLSFATAYLTGESEALRLIHVYAGGTVLGIVIFRTIWGVVGTPMARFSQYVRSPKQAWVYLSQLLGAHPQHYVGHNPAGAWAILGLLSLSAATSIMGRFAYQTDAAHVFESLHEFFANATLGLVVLHVAAIVVSGYLHRDPLVKAMLRGYKQLPENHCQILSPQAMQDFSQGFSIRIQCFGLLCLALCIALSVWWVQL